MIVTVENLFKSFGNVNAVNGLSFHMESGDILGFVGPNGAGKTTTLRIMATLDLPSRGDVKVNGESIIVNPEIAQRNVSFVPDSMTVQKDMTVHEYLDFFARLYGLKNPKRRRIVEEIEDFTNLTGIKYKLTANLSKGMMQRVSIARALINEPKIILMDEPAAGLDPRARIELRELLKVLAQQKKSILISSHILSDLDEICTSTLIVERGNLLKFGKVSEMVAEHEVKSSAQTRRLSLTPIGDPESAVNFLLLEPGISGVNVLDKTIDFEYEGDEEASSELLFKLMSNGIKIIDFKVKRQSLESIFMDVTKGELQ
jgi:ABC-2 type transport system ATP-binding protein